VIEVNLNPTSSWDEMVKQTETLYEEARLARLGTEKFMVDGRHTGTGRRNHIVIGGATRPTRPCCVGPTCCVPSWDTGRTIRRSRFYSAASSSTDQPESAHRRSAQRFALRTRSRVSPGADKGDVAPGSSTAFSATCS